MFTRPSLRAVVATTAAATLLVGGANLASYAATHHGHNHGASAAKAAQPKTIAFHLGKPGQKFAGASVHLLSARVPKGTYEIAMSGLILDLQTSSNTDSYSCLVADRKTILRGLHHGLTTASYHHIYALDGDSQGSFKFGDLDNVNPAQRIDRRTIAVGCLFTGSASYTIGRTLTFTLTPVKVTHGSATAIPVARSQAHRLSALLR